MAITAANLPDEDRPPVNAALFATAPFLGFINELLILCRPVSIMRRPVSIHAYMTVLVIGIVLPFLVFGGLLVERATRTEQALIAERVRDAANGAAADINRQIQSLRTWALAIARSRLVAAGDVRALQEQVADLVRGLGLTVVLYDRHGQQLMNTDVPFGTPLPIAPEVVGEMLKTQQLEISDLAPDPRTGEPSVSINVPVFREEALFYVLSLQITRAIAAVMTEQLAHPEYVVGLVDRSGTIIHRTRDPQEVVGLSAPERFIANTAGMDRGAFISVSRKGVPVYIAFSRVRLPGWTLAVSIPSDELFAPATRSMIMLLTAGAGMLGVAGLIAWLIGRSITGSVAGLARLASALGAGTPIIEPAVSRLREVQDVATLMNSETAALQREIATRRRIERQLVQAQKMEAIGQLTGGLAHDFNNLLAIIIGNLDMLQEQSWVQPDSRDLISGSLEAALRGADLTRQMLAFARRQPLAPEQCDVNRVVRSIVRLLDRTLGEDIAIDLRLATDLWPVLIDRSQLTSTIANLATNARDAMPSGELLTVTTRNTSLDEDYAASHTEVTPGNYVLIEVSDTGTGMPADVLQHIFEPFFTTKEPGRGTGLGLSMVFGFMKQSGGHITAYSEVGHGSTFHLYLPPLPEAVRPTRWPRYRRQNQGRKRRFLLSRTVNGCARSSHGS